MSHEYLATPEKFHGFDSWSEAKSDDSSKNEDVAYYDDNVLVLADGETDKSGVVYPSGKTGGQSLAEIAVRVAARSNRRGYNLVDEVTAAAVDFYHQDNPQAIFDASKRAATTLLTARILGGNLVVTQVGDSNARIIMRDGSAVTLTNDKQIDSDNAAIRSQHIKDNLAEFIRQNGRRPSDTEKDDIIKSGRGSIQEQLDTQYRLRNNTDDARYGYGKIDGTSVPRNFSDGRPTNYVKTFEFPVSKVRSVELVSDGFYGEFPDEPTVLSYQAIYERIHAEDPDKYLKYPSTKSKDDATVLIAQL